MLEHSLIKGDFLGQKGMSSPWLALGWWDRLAYTSPPVMPTVVWLWPDEAALGLRKMRMK